MKTILLTGEPDVGKTTTLKQLYLALLKKGAVIIAEPKQCIESPSDDEYFIEYKKKKIVIITSGDLGYAIIWHIAYWSAKDIDILIIANRKESPYWALDKFKVPCEIVEKIKVEDPSKIDEAVSDTVDEIIKKI